MTDEIPADIWETVDEIEYLKTIGNYKVYLVEMNEGDMLNEKVKLLTGYLRGSLKRTQWNVMNRNVIIDFARKELSRLKARAPLAGIG
jgi:hypothetical protein